MTTHFGPSPGVKTVWKTAMNETATLYCPIDQLHICGLLSSDEDRALIRYTAAKMLRSCDPISFARVSREFPEQEALVFQVIRGSIILPSSSEKWLPELWKALDRAAEFWGLQ